MCGGLQLALLLFPFSLEWKKTYPSHVAHESDSSIRRSLGRLTSKQKLLSNKQMKTSPGIL